MLIRYAAVPALAAALLAGCGGAGNDTHPVAAPPPPVAPAPAPANMVPASATVSIQAFFAYVGSLVASETAAPLLVEGVTPPTSETAAPLPVN